MFKFFMPLIAMLCMSGCAMMGNDPYPVKERYQLYVENTVIPEWESAGSEYKIDNSQVSISSPEKLKNWQGLSAFIAFSVNKKNSESLIENLQTDLNLTFKKELDYGFSKLQGIPHNKFNLSDEKQADIVLYPTATLHIIDKENVKLSFQIEARYGYKRKWYGYSLPQKYTLTGEGGLIDKHSEIIKQQAAIIFEALASLVVDDINNRITTPKEIKEIPYKDMFFIEGKEVPFVYLRMSGKYLVAAPIWDSGISQSSKKLVDRDDAKFISN